METREDVPLMLSLSPSHCPDSPDTPLSYQEFWPACLHAEEGFSNVHFELFGALVSRANVWLKENSSIDLLKCETLEKKITSADALSNDDLQFDVPSEDTNVYSVHGLRLWYRRVKTEVRVHTIHLGYKNIVPQCLETTRSSLIFEDLSQMYEFVNESLIENPLEGVIITMETVAVKLRRPDWAGEPVDAERTCWPDSAKYHILNIGRIFYIHLFPAYEQVGAADFLPQLVCQSPEKSSRTKYADFNTALVKVNLWLPKVKDIRLVNVQTLEAAVPGINKADKVNTSENFQPKADTTPFVRFIRVTYVRPKYGLPPGGLYVPRQLTYEVFVPQDVSTDGGALVFESEREHWSRVLAWLQHSGELVVSTEVFYHPLRLAHCRGDRAERTLMKGTWTFAPNSQSEHGERLQRVAQLRIIRLYLDSNGRHSRRGTATKHVAFESESCCVL